jgi:hypothetical protein
MRHVFMFAAVAAMPLIGLEQVYQPAGPAPDARVQRTLRFADGAASRSLEIDTVWGGINVTAHDRDTVDVVATRTVEAKTAEARAAADREVRLDITDNVADLRLYVEGPFRDCDHEGRRRSWRNPGYEVRYDFEVRLPRGIRLHLRTINDGDIAVQGTSGRFEIRNINGEISLRDIEGTGEASTINGDLTVGYRSNPRGDVRLKTLNGELVARSTRTSTSRRFRQLRPRASGVAARGCGRLRHAPACGSGPADRPSAWKPSTAISGFFGASHEIRFDGVRDGRGTRPRRVGSQRVGPPGHPGETGAARGPRTGRGRPLRAAGGAVERSRAAGHAARERDAGRHRRPGLRR